MSKTAKETIKSNFSKYAKTYDKHASVQKLAAQKLAVMIPKDGISTVLDIGCGTGIFTEIIKAKFKGSNIIAMDISDQMISVAKQKLGDDKVMFVSGDAEEIDLPVKFDLITSNATFQWFRKMDSTLSKYAALLEKKGSLIFSTFGPLTYHELARSIREVLKKNVYISSRNFLSKNELEHLLEKNFKKFKIIEHLIIEKNRSLKDLLRKIKYTGTQGSGIREDRYIGKDRMKKIEEIYRSRHKNMEATHHLFFCEALA
ncbi:MAG: malonyl-ACP O-methyltransferase BioC [Candidatus Margulisiibacteriota bacterium]